MKRSVLIIVLFLTTSYLVFAQNINQKEANVSYSWQPLNSDYIPLDINTDISQGIGRTECVEFDPNNSSLLYIATSGGIWKSSETTLRWIPLSDFLPSTSVSDIEVDPANSSVIYIATGDKNSSVSYSTGIYKSIDSGLTWNETGLNFSLSEKKNIYSLIISIENSNILFAGTSDGLFKSTDAGATWYCVLENFKIIDIEAPNDIQSHLFATSFDFNGGSHIFKSIDYGESFELSEPEGFPSDQISRIELSISDGNNNIVYALCSDASTNSMLALYKSKNYGEIWMQVIGNQQKDLLSFSYLGENDNGSASSNMCIFSSPESGDTVIVGGTHLWKSTDGGYSFSLLKNCYIQDERYVFPNHHFIAQNTDGKLFLCNDGGIYISENSGNTWLNVSEGLSIAQTVDIEISSSISDYILSTNAYTFPVLFNENQVFSISESISYNCISDYSDKDVIYLTRENGEILKSEDLGISFINILEQNPTSENVALAINKNNPNILYYGYRNIYISENKGETWQVLCKIPQWSGVIKKIVLSSSSDNIFYILTSNEIWRTKDGGKTWTEIELPFSVDDEPAFLSTLSLEIDYNDPNLIWLAYANYSEGNKVFGSETGGEIWTNISNNLPNVRINCIKSQHGTDGGIYAGTDAGIYYFDNTMYEWVLYNENLPNSIITDLEINYQTNKIYAATFGRGIWLTDLFVKENLKPIASFTVNNLKPCLKEDIQLVDLSAYSPVFWKWDIVPAFFEFTQNTNSNSQNPVVFFKQDGVYTITLTVFNEFGSDTKIKTNFIFAGKPFSDFTYTSFSNEFYFKNLSFNADNYLWNFDDGTTSTEKDPVHIFQEEGFYATELLVTNRCGDDNVTKNINVIILQLEKSDNDIQIFPNPSDGKIFIKIPDELKGLQLEVYNLSGIKILSSGLSKVQTEIELQPGIYFCNFKDSNIKFSKKIIVR